MERKEALSKQIERDRAEANWCEKAGHHQMASLYRRDVLRYEEELALHVEVEKLREENKRLRQGNKELKNEQKKPIQNAHLPSAVEMEYHSPLFEHTRPPYRLHRPDGRSHDEASSGPGASVPAADDANHEQTRKGERRGIQRDVDGEGEE